MSESTATIKKGTCPVCGSACFIKAHLTEGKITKVEPDQESLFGHLCERGANAIEYHYHPKRLNYPLKPKFYSDLPGSSVICHFRERGRK